MGSDFCLVVDPFVEPEVVEVAGYRLAECQIVADLLVARGVGVDRIDMRRDFCLCNHIAIDVENGGFVARLELANNGQVNPLCGYQRVVAALEAVRTADIVPA